LRAVTGEPQRLALGLLGEVPLREAGDGEALEEAALGVLWREDQRSA